MFSKTHSYQLGTTPLTHYPRKPQLPMTRHINASQPSATPLSRHISELNKQYVHAKPIAINPTSPLPPQTTAQIPRHFQAVGITPVTYSLLPSTTDSRKVCQNPVTESFIKGVSAQVLTDNKSLIFKLAEFWSAEKR